MKKKQTTLRRRLVLLLTLFFVLQLVIVSFLFIKGGIISTAQNNALGTLNSLTSNRCFSLSNEMLGRWGNLANSQKQISAQIDAVLAEKGITVQQLLSDPALAQEVTALCAESVISLLRQNGVTDAFFILDTPGSTFHAAGKAAFSVRDYDPQSYTSQNTDLLMECGLPALARTQGMPLDSGWTALFDLPAEGDTADFFHLPIQRARQASLSTRMSSNYLYWSSTQLFGKETLTCSIPLILGGGDVVGVVGVAVLAEYVSSVLHYEELDMARQGAYVLATSADGGATYQPLVAAGSAFSAFFREGDTLVADNSKDYLRFPSTLHPQSAVAASVRRLDTKSGSSIQGDDKHMVLIGMMGEDHLFQPAANLQQAMTLAVLLTFLVGLVATVLVTQAITAPITQLVRRLYQHDALSPIHLPPTHIREIDALSSAIEEQNQGAIEAASRNSQIIAMTGLPLGVFDYMQGGSKVFVSRELFSLLNWERSPEREQDTFVTMEEFQQWWNVADQEYRLDQEPDIYRIPLGENERRYVQLFYHREGERTLGAYLDVTKSVEERRKIEYERDYDVLTSLLNRRAFDFHMEALFQKPEQLKVAAMLMFDLDNMKYTNDTFGHDGGDSYLQTFAKGLQAFQAYPSLIGRRSGDEFTVFLYGFNSQAEIRTVVNKVGQVLSTLTLDFPGNAPLRVRTSGGIAWYPTHSDDYSELLRMADFAMYDIKRTVKGVIREFDPAEYRKRGILIYGQDALNRLIDERMVRYAFQPILSARDGTLYGYELLMRPQVPELTSMNDLFQLAKAQSKLHQIEYLTWFESMATCAHYAKTGQLANDAKLFVNSIGSQCLTSQDAQRLEGQFSHLLSRLVLEVTELEEISFSYTDFKRAFVDHWNAQIALDDYGTGFSSESVLMRIQPHVVKVDLSIVRGVDADSDRQTLIHNLIVFCSRRNIRVLAEGVETYEELATLISLGVDYLQGYYLARPNFIPQPIDPTITAEVQSLYQEFSKLNDTHPQTPIT